MNEELEELENVVPTTVLEVQEVLDSVKIEDDVVDKTPKKRGPRKKDLPTPDEVNNMSDKEVLGLSKQVEDLYSEFNSFLETKAKIISDTGVKDVIPTGIEVLDAFLGGGFAVGTMSVIAGTPGSGKCLHYDEVVEIYYE